MRLSRELERARESRTWLGRELQRERGSHSQELAFLCGAFVRIFFAWVMPQVPKTAPTSAQPLPPMVLPGASGGRTCLLPASTGAEVGGVTSAMFVQRTAGAPAGGKDVATGGAASASFAERVGVFPGGQGTCERPLEPARASQRSPPGTWGLLLARDGTPALAPTDPYADGSGAERRSTSKRSSAG